MIVSGAASFFSSHSTFYKGLELQRLDDPELMQASILTASGKIPVTDFSRIKMENETRLAGAIPNTKKQQPKLRSHKSEESSADADNSPCGKKGTPIIKDAKIIGCAFD